MTLNEIESGVRALSASQLEVRQYSEVPSADRIDARMGAAKVDAAVLFVDMKESTSLMSGHVSEFSAKVYKTFLSTTASVVENEGGVVASFSGDRLLAIFTGEMKCSNATRAALRLHSAAKRVNQVLAETVAASGYQLNYTAGVDCGEVIGIRTGIRSGDDVCWVGRCINTAAKLAAFRGRSEKALITSTVFERLHSSSKQGGDPPRCMWDPMGFAVDGFAVYGSSWWWNF